MNKNNKITAAAVQLDTIINNVEHNLNRCRMLVEQAYQSGASWIALPEFFNTGVSWMPEIVDSIESEQGLSSAMLKSLSEKYSIVLGGSFLCRIENGSVRNRYLCFYNGTLIGKHDKDLPTMWENAFYEGGDADDTGELGEIEGVRVGTAVCWEFFRTQTSRRLKNKIDVLIGGSHWWSIPTNWPNWLHNLLEAGNKVNTLKVVQETALLIGAPVIHASHCNKFSCRIPGSPLPYQGYLEGNAAIIDGYGNVLACRKQEEGEGFVIADISLGSVNSNKNIPEKYWLRPRGVVPAFSWYFHGLLGRRWYKKHVR